MRSISQYSPIAQTFSTLIYETHITVFLPTTDFYCFLLYRHAIVTQECIRDEIRVRLNELVIWHIVESSCIRAERLGKIITIFKEAYNNKKETKKRDKWLSKQYDKITNTNLIKKYIYGPIYFIIFDFIFFILYLYANLSFLMPQ